MCTPIYIVHRPLYKELQYCNKIEILEQYHNSLNGAFLVKVGMFYHYVC